MGNIKKEYHFCDVSFRSMVSIREEENLLEVNKKHKGRKKFALYKVF